MTHIIKIRTEYYNAVLAGRKKFELRRDDRFFREGDSVILKEWNACEEKYTGRWQQVEISYVLRDCPEYGLMPGFCIFGWR